jgi:hypothetical protein
VAKSEKRGENLYLRRPTRAEMQSPHVPRTCDRWSESAWKNSAWVNVSITCAGEYVGLEEIDNGIWNVYFGPLKLGRLSEEQMRIEDAYGSLWRRLVTFLNRTINSRQSVRCCALALEAM